METNLFSESAHCWKKMHLRKIVFKKFSRLHRIAGGGVAPRVHVSFHIEFKLLVVADQLKVNRVSCHLGFLPLYPSPLNQWKKK